MNVNYHSLKDSIFSVDLDRGSSILYRGSRFEIYYGLIGEVESPADRVKVEVPGKAKGRIPRAMKGNISVSRELPEMEGLSAAFYGVLLADLKDLQENNLEDAKELAIDYETRFSREIGLDDNDREVPLRSHILKKERKKTITLDKYREK